MSNLVGRTRSLSYLGTSANQPPNWTFHVRPPTERDNKNFQVGDLWWNSSAEGIDRIWILVGLEGTEGSKGQLAHWVQFRNGTVATEYDADVGTAVPANGVLNVFGTGGISTMGSGNTLIINGTGGNTIKITKYDTVGSFLWEKDVRTTWITIYGIHGGSGGGSGRRGLSTQAGGGGGGGGGGGFFFDGAAEFFDDTATVVVGAGGSGGAAQTVNDTDGNPGVVGSPSSFGNLGYVETQFYPFPAPSTTNSGGRNGFANAVGSYNATSDQNLTVVFGITQQNSTGGLGSLTDGIAPFTNGYWGTPPVTLTTPRIGGYGGGGGGGADSGTIRDGSVSLTISNPNSTVIYLNGGTAGSESTVIDGGNGSDADYVTTRVGYLYGATGGGGGGGQSAGLVAGNGGNGGIPGGGGGGGGGSLNGTNSGAGGDGGRGEVWVFEIF